MAAPDDPHRPTASEARRLREKLAALDDRSDLMLGIIYPKKQRIAEEAELLAVEGELARVRSGASPDA
jgi:hypothetical protein